MYTEEVELFNKKVKFKSFLCTNDKNKPRKSKPSFRLSIKLTDSCNSSCLFCANKNTKDFGELDFDKIEKVVRELNKTGYLIGVSITGGEPMLYPDKVNKLINLITSIDEKVNICITTNGINLRKFAEFDNLERIESLHISRHHYDDDINREIFHSDDIATSEDIKYLQSIVKDKLIININTVLIKGYIDNIEEVKKMFEYADSLGIRRVGIVSLIKLNEYAKDNFIDFNDIFDKKDSSFFIGHHLYSYDYCECIDGIYSADSQNILEFYARMGKEKECPFVTQLVYTTDNKLKTGFNGEVIY